MILGDLLTVLEDHLATTQNSDIEVRLGTQPNYPLISTIKRVVHVVPDEDEEDQTEALYILEGAGLGYGNKDWW